MGKSALLPRPLTRHTSLVEQDEPEARIADLERQSAKPRAVFGDPGTLAGAAPSGAKGVGGPVGVGPQPAFPSGPAVRRQRGPLAQLRRWVARLFAIGGVAVSLAFFGLGAYDYYAHLVGTRGRGRSGAASPSAWASRARARGMSTKSHTA
jgi:hypothetical protein